MVAPPLAWHRPANAPDTLPMGGEYHVDTTLVRTNSRRHLQQIAALPTADFQQVLDGLNALMATKWRVNERVLRIIECAAPRRVA